MINTKIGRPCVRLHQLNFIRSITINQQPSSTISTEQLTKTTTIPSNIQQVEELTNSRTLEAPEFKTLGNSGSSTTTTSSSSSILSINLPPSVPIYLKRGSLLSIYGIKQDITSINSVRSSLEFPLFWKKLIYGIDSNKGYQRLISTSPFSILVSSQSRRGGSIFSKNNGDKLFVNLILDGGTDWAILKNDSIQAYSGNSLNLNIYKLPNYISKKLSKKLGFGNKKFKTGLISWINRKIGYILISGRGNVGLIGNGNIYNLNLIKNEEILINKENLLGITVNGPYDLQNCIIKYQFPLKDQSIIDSNTSDVIIEKPKLYEPNSWGMIKYRFDQFNKSFKKIFQSIFKYSSDVKESGFNYLVGNQEFIKIIGPRNILIQSNVDNSFIIPSIKRSDKIVTPVKSNDNTEVKKSTTTGDYLNYVTIEPGKGAVFKSTPDFKDTVDQIDNKSK